MIRNRVLPALGAFLLVGTGSMIVAPSSYAATQNCGSTVDNPHYSKGAAGNIVKSRTSCVGNVAEVRVGLTLWKCPNSPHGEKDTWGGQGCAIVKAGSRVVKNPTDGTKYTTYAPPSGSTGATGKGWYAGVATTTAYNLNGQNIVLKHEGSSWTYLAS
jgi:hypothetical protein